MQGTSSYIWCLRSTLKDTNYFSLATQNHREVCCVEFVFSIVNFSSASCLRVTSAGRFGTWGGVQPAQSPATGPGRDRPNCSSTSRGSGGSLTDTRTSTYFSKLDMMVFSFKKVLCCFTVKVALWHLFYSEEPIADSTPKLYFFALCPVCLCVCVHVFVSIEWNWVSFISPYSLSL